MVKGMLAAECTTQLPPCGTKAPVPQPWQCWCMITESHTPPLDYSLLRRDALLSACFREQPTSNCWLMQSLKRLVPLSSFGTTLQGHSGSLISRLSEVFVVASQPSSWYCLLCPLTGVDLDNICSWVCTWSGCTFSGGCSAIAVSQEVYMVLSWLRCW